ncbi:ATP-dependent RNA helicase CHL1 [Spathaspora passalidarum NRRL Y-27907]|uniref:ATP-dependent DNA helicase CHL1 n=1 Tax=Spathaspora passalidarum (strain NRRL Y-27907 / 11-Y1) TaxID=619300 RepID=G3AK80_SPAPN|nr:ATP-dependent RNA helicase CHL1 [Spathaspora passalidarum NRRL Y-27907]EGW33539.1 ATP-dependent RNA helicase CHL1 [Spathaspora passalidarum NRRL Y-27907]
MTGRLSPRKYNHPYDPYTIQIQLMNAVYDTISNDYKIGIFESPTGTGKTLSLICSSMTWLRHYKRNHIFSEVVDNNSEDSDDEPEWVKTAYRESIVSRSKGKIREFEEHLDKLEKDYDQNKRREAELKSRPKKKFKPADSDESMFLPVDYHSDSETTTDESTELARQIEELKKKLAPKKDVDYANDCPTKIFYCSRTHSQLNQFAGQLRLTKFESSFDDLQERTKYLPLGSRKQLCINDKVRSQVTVQSMNDACIDLQKSKEGCKFLPKNYVDSDLVKEFSELSVAKIRDIEDLGILGTDLNVCPYYSVRGGIELTEIISLPYQMIFQDSTRDIMKLDVKDSIVIIDEAHNIMDVITSLYSVSITADNLDRVIKSLKFYLGKFIKKLNSGNRINLQKLIKICQSLRNFINDKSGKVKPGDEINVDDIFQDSTADLVNIHKLEKFLSKTKIAYKIENYLEKIEIENETNTTIRSSSSTPLLFSVVSFLKSLTHPSTEGKFFWDVTNNTTTINYMLLDPSGVFKDILNQAKCILLCGGTMEPMSDYADYLFPSVLPEKVNKFTCGHVIPKENLDVFTVTEMNGIDFEFSFNKRNNAVQLNALGSFIIEVCKRVPYGIVIFFPSYKYLNQVLMEWKKSNLLNSISQLKSVFQEPSDATKVEQTLSEYSTAAQAKGAILFSVVGGKMSEGINFSDNLARAVLMVGLPYPNAFSGEMVAKRNFIEKNVISKGGTNNEAKEKSMNYYENLCMRAVNQSIGRSIRHIKDYSIIYLIDSRFKYPRIQIKLSKWVRDRLQATNNTSQIFNQTEEFFLNKSVTTDV